MASKKKSKAKFTPDSTMPVFKFENDEWRKEVAGIFLRYGHLIRTGELHAVQLFAELNTWRNILAENLDMQAIEDPESLTTMVFPNPKVRVNDPSYR